MSEFISQLHFIRPLLLLALPIALFIVWYVQKSSSKDDGWAQICDPHLLDALKVSSGGKGNKWTLLLWPIVIIASLAAAGPAFRKLPTPVIKNQSALVVVLDVSKSMLADDLKPNRLERAKYKIEDILAQRKDGQTALLVYAGDAFVVTPLTDDTETIALMLKAISPEIMPVQGSRVDLALEKARELLKQGGYSRGEIILIADGVNLSKAKSKVKELRNDAIKTSVLAVGTEQGAKIHTQAGVLKDRSGKEVIVKLNVNDLAELANVGGGRFSQITGDSSDINKVLPTKVENGNNKHNNKEQENNEDDSFTSAKYIDEGPWLTLLLLPLIVLLFRKGLLLSLFLVVGLHAPVESTYAFGWDDLWLNSDQQAAKNITQGNAKAALEVAKSDEFKAAAAYKIEDYKQASELFNGETLDNYYNHGNALAQSGKLEEALKSYDKALKINPNNEDTLYNKEQVEKALEEQKQQEQKDNKDKKNQDDQDKEKQDKENKDQDNKDEESKDGEENEGEKKDGEQKDGEENKDQKDNPEQQKEKEKQPSEMSEEEKKKQQEEKEKLEKADKEQKEKEAKEKQKKQQEMKLTPEEKAENAEKKEAIEQWLRRIPDDPGGLLRRKFYYQYNRQQNKPDETEDW